MGTLDNEDTNRQLNETVKSFPVTAWDVLTESAPRMTDNLGNVSSILIPPLQRQYVWGAAQAAQLIKDIVSSPVNSPHYLGIIQMNMSTDSRRTVLELIDGQQRLTTLFIWYMSAFHHMAAETENPDLPEPLLRASRFSYLSPGFSGKAVKLNSDIEAIESLTELELIAPDETPSLSDRRMREVFKYFMQWWSDNPQDHPDLVVQQALQDNTAMLFVVAPRFASPQRFVDQSKNISLTTFDKLVGNMMEQHPDIYLNDISDNVELSWLKDNVKAYLAGDNVQKFDEAAAKWGIDTAIKEPSQLRKEISGVRIRRDLEEGGREPERQIFESLADTTLVSEERRPIWVRKTTKQSMEEDYQTILANAVDSIGLGFVHSRHRDSDHEGTSKNNMFSKTLGIKGDQAIEKIASSLVFDPTPVKDRLERLTVILNDIHDTYKNVHPALVEHETNLGAMFNSKAIHNALGTLAYYADNSSVLVEGVVNAAMFMHAWMPVIDMVYDSKEMMTKWDSLICSTIEKSGRRDWTVEQADRITEMSKVMVCEALYTGPNPIGCDIEKMNTYILQGDIWLDTQDKPMKEILHETYETINATHEKTGELKAFSSIAWRAATQDFDKATKLNRWFLWAISEHSDIIISSQGSEVLKENGVTATSGTVWVPSKTKPFTKESISTESWLWMFEPEADYARRRFTDIVFLTLPVLDLDVRKAEQDGVFCNKLGCFTEEDKIEIDPDLLKYGENSNILGAMVSIALRTSDDGSRSAESFKEVSKELFNSVVAKTFPYSDKPEI